jgi:cell division protein FtsI (penicillin-binding protein 3)
MSKSPFTWLPEALAATRKPIDLARTRLLVMGVFCCLGFAGMTGKLFHATFIHNNYLDYGANACNSVDMPLARADILDRNGLILATSVQTSSLYANALILLNPQEASDKLLTVLPHLKRESLRKKLNSKKAFVWIARHLTPKQEADIIRLGIPGLDFRPDVRRIYPYGPLISHVIGYTDIDNKGIFGLEHTLQNQIHGRDKPIVTSLDVRLQHIVYDELYKGIQEFQAIGGCAILQDTVTGEILSLVSLPDFDPNTPKESTVEDQFNRATLGVYEQGSVFKIFNTALALEEGVATPSTLYDVSKPMQVGRFRLTDFKPHNGHYSVAEIFINSSNIGSAKMALEVGCEKQKEFFKRMGFFESAKVEISEIGKPLYAQQWREANTITASYGYGVAVSPLHVTSAVSAIANDGLMVQPTFLKRMHPGPNVTKTVLSKPTARSVLKLMRAMVDSGTGRKAQVVGVSVTGKTGTTNWRNNAGRGYQKKEVRTVFVGSFPRNSRYVLYVMLDKPERLKKTFGFNNAGWNASPVAGNIIRRLAPVLKITPELDPQTHYDVVEPFHLQNVSFQQ